MSQIAHVAVREVNNIPEVSLTAKDGLFIATECHLALLPDEDGDTALHLAVIQGNVEACTKLLELPVFHIAGKSIDVQNSLLQTPLHVAVITNNKDIVKLLVRHGSDPNNPDRYGSTAFHICAKYDHAECLQEILQAVGNRKLNLNRRDYEGLTALHVAVINGSVQTFKLLVAHGIDIDAKDNKGGRTPLIYAIEANERAIVEMLLECDASVSQQTYSGDTALHIASGRGLQDIVRLLLRRGADATMKNTHCETPISLASSPSVSDILKMQYRPNTSPETKPLTTADSQYASYIARNIAVPIPPQFLFGLTMDDDKVSAEQLRIQKRGRKLKTEHMGFDNDEATPAKRAAVSTSTLPSMTSIPIVVPVPPLHANKSSAIRENNTGPSHKITVKHEYVEIQSPHLVQTMEQDENINSLNESSRASDNKDDEAYKKESDSCEEIEITMEEVEVSAEEVVQSKSGSDDEDKYPENHPLSVTEDHKQGSAGNNSNSEAHETYKHKLMLYSTNNMNKSTQENMNTTNTNVQKFAPNNGKEHLENKPVIVQRQPQIDVATALSREYRINYPTNPTYNSFTPSASPMPINSTQAIVKSKSVPNSPQPLEANLYQLAREGLAVAAMANSSNPHQFSNREFGITNYLKARPSRQAKIKAGTEELQNLALQGLAVAAMNAQSELFQNNPAKKNFKSAEEGDILSSVTTVPKHFGQVLNPVVGSVAPLLQRSNSMPQKQYYERTDQDTFSASHKNHMSSNHALLALAHANARKEHVGQAVSAISMGRAQHAIPMKYHAVATDVQTTSSDVSESTKLNLRQAIMVKNTAANPPSAQKLPKVEVYDPKARKFQICDPNNPALKNYITKSADTTAKNTLSIKIVPTSSKKTNFITPPRFPRLDNISGGFVTTTASLQSPSALLLSSKPEISRPRSPVLSKVLNVSIPRRPEKIVVPASPQHVPPVETEKKSEKSLGEGPATFGTASQSKIKPTKDSAPTNTVAPLQLINNKRIPPVSRKTEQQTLISVAMAPIVASRVSSPASSLQFPSATNQPAPEPTESPANIPQPQTLTTTVTNSVVGGPSTTIPQVAIGLQPPQVITPTLANLGLVGAHGGAPYLQPQIAYVPHGKDLIPVIMSHTAFHPQVQFPQYAHALHVQASQAVTTPNVSSVANTPVSSNGLQLSQAYLNSLAARMPTIDPNLLSRIPLSVQDPQMRGMYPVAASMYGGQPLDVFQQQQYLKNVLLYQQQQSLLRVGAPTAAITPKPVAAVSAVPVQKTTPSTDANKMASPSADEQPLNLSKKFTDQPLNLMKSHSTSHTSAPTEREASVRSSVIKAISCVQNDQPKNPVADNPGIASGSHQITPITTVLPSFGDQQVHPGVILPPPLIFPGQAPQAALSSLSLPPIHYVNGMPYFLGVPPQM